MWTPNDYVKYYYLAPPAVFGQNYTANIQINVLTPGFQPYVYLLRNEVPNFQLNVT